jgi:hypothetical protein
MLPSIGVMIVIAGLALLAGLLVTAVVERRVQRTRLSKPGQAVLVALAAGGAGLAVLMTPVWYWVASDLYFDRKCARESGVHIPVAPLVIKTLIVRDDSARRELDRVGPGGLCQHNCNSLVGLVRARLSPLFDAQTIDVYLVGDKGNPVRVWLAKADDPRCVAHESSLRDGLCVAADFSLPTSLAAAHILVEEPFIRCEGQRDCWARSDKNEWLGVRRVEHHITDPSSNVVARIIGFERGVPEFLWKTCPKERRSGGLPKALVRAVVGTP